MKKTVADYLALGYDERTAAYFAAGRKRLTSVSANPDFTLTLIYDGHEKRLYDMRPVLDKGGVFANIWQWADFQRVYLDETSSVCWDIDPAVDSNVVWSNLIDLCPDSCYLDSVPLSQS